MKKTHLIPALALILAPSLALADPGAAAAALARGKQSPAEAAAAWKQDGITPRRALRLVSQRPTRAPLAPGNHDLKLIDTHQRETQLLVHVPEQPRADGTYGLLVVLHGYGGNAKQLFQFGQNVAPPGTIVAAMSAKRLPNELEGVDVPKLGLVSAFSKHWWSYRTDGFPMLTVKKLIREFPVDTNRVLLAGYSMGGFGTWNIGLRHHQQFAALAPMAGGISRSEYLARRDPRSRVLLQNALMEPTFFIHGGADPVVPTRFSRTIDKELTQLHARHTFIEVPGGNHVLYPFLRGNEQTEVLKAFLAKAVRDPNPRVVTHAAVTPDSGRAYWTRIDKLAGPTATLRAEVKPGNRIEVTTEHVAKLTLYLDPDLLDVKAPVTVVLNGEVVHRGRVRPSLKAVAESFADGACDPDLTYDHALTLVDPHAKTPAASAPKASAPRPTKKAKKHKRWF